MTPGIFCGTERKTLTTMNRPLFIEVLIAVTGLSFGVYLTSTGVENRSIFASGSVLLGALFAVSGLMFLHFGIKSFLKYKR